MIQYSQDLWTELQGKRNVKTVFIFIKRINHKDSCNTITPNWFQGKFQSIQIYWIAPRFNHTYDMQRETQRKYSMAHGLPQLFPLT